MNRDVKEIIMLIESTLYVHKSILEKLERGAILSGRSRTFIIKQLMERLMDDNQNLISPSSRIKYQERDVKANWRILHIVVNEYEYEYYLDMRKFYKMSVSFLLAYAVRQYLNAVINESLDNNINTDNYLYRNYIFTKKKVDGIVCWQIYWGLPIKLPLR
jgi:spore coat polysaccharide biosynthesis predicted glycosyltransferase SpsG